MLLTGEPLLLRCGDDLYPSLPLALVEAAVGKRSMVVGDPLGVQDVILAGSAMLKSSMYAMSIHSNLGWKRPGCQSARVLESVFVRVVRSSG